MENKFKVEDYQVTGIAAPYLKRSQNLDGFYEIIEYGAFESVLATNPEVYAVVNHSRKVEDVLGSTEGQTLQLESTPEGLAFKLDVARTATGTSVIELIKRGDISKMSFAFTVDQDSWEDEGGEMTRTIKSFKSLSDISIVLTPAYNDTLIK